MHTAENAKPWTL